MREIPGEIHYDSDVEYVAHLFDTLDDDNDIEDLEKVKITGGTRSPGERPNVI